MELFQRIIFTLQKWYQYRHALAIVQDFHNCQLHQIAPAKLKIKATLILVLDFDGVLAAHGEIYPTPELHGWLTECVSIFGADKIFILSNKPLPARIAYFNQHYPGVQYIADVKKKPYPDGLQKIMALTGQRAEALRLVDDRLLTGGLAACIANVPMTYISRPYVSLSKRPIKELFFMSLRFLERWLVPLLRLLPQKQTK